MTAWLLAMLLACVPPGRTPRETEAEGRARYASIAEDISTTTHDVRSAALLVAIAVHESGLRVDVDDGRTKGDAGRAVGLWQLQGVSDGLTRREQANIALGRVQRSFRACGAGRYGLAAYASGSCSRGLAESAALVDSWHRLLAAQGAP